MMMKKPFTGWHMTTILVSFFAVVIVVNLIMAKFAITTFGGTVVDNSYVASQQFNRWIDKAEAQRAAGWRITTAMAADRHLWVELATPATITPPPVIKAQATHVLGREAAINVTLNHQPDGRWLSEQPLPLGRWELRIDMPDQQGGEVHFNETVG